MNLDTLTDDVLARCDRLGGISEEPGRLTRTFLCDRVREVHELLTSWMTQAGLAVRLDAAGNLVGQSMPASRHERVFLVGSHIDTVRTGGIYDGNLGVLAGLEDPSALAPRLAAVRVPALVVVGLKSSVSSRSMSSNVPWTPATSTVASSASRSSSISAQNVPDAGCD